MSSTTVRRALALIGSLTASAALVGAAQAATTPKPPKPPSVYTASPVPVTDSSATLKVKVNPHGLATEYDFQYGPTTAYGSQSPTASAGSGDQEGLLSELVAGLQADTVYHYRAVATNSAGTTFGRDATFTTKKIPLSLAAAATLSPIVFGSPLDVTGTLTGTGAIGVQVVLQANTFPYDHHFHDITSPEPTNAAGGFSFPIAGLLQSTQLRVATVAKPLVYSPVITELVAVRVALHVRPARRHGFVRLYGTVTPSKAGERVAFERLDRAQHRFTVVSGTVIRGFSEASRFGRVLRLRPGVYRAFVQVAGGAQVSGPQVSGRSRPILIR